jgi:hypothetical protein
MCWSRTRRTTSAPSPRAIAGLATISYDAVTGKGANRISFAQVDVARAAEYAAEDADVTLRVHQVLRPQLAAAPELEALYRDLELPIAEVLFRHRAQRRADRRGDAWRSKATNSGARSWPSRPRRNSWPASPST